MACKVEKAAGFKCGTFAASSVESRHLATGDFAGNVTLTKYAWDAGAGNWTLARAYGLTPVALEGGGGVLEVAGVRGMSAAVRIAGENVADCGRPVSASDQEPLRAQSLSCLVVIYLFIYLFRLSPAGLD